MALRVSESPSSSIFCYKTRCEGWLESLGLRSYLAQHMSSTTTAHPGQNMASRRGISLESMAHHARLLVRLCLARCALEDLTDV